MRAAMRPSALGQGQVIDEPRQSGIEDRADVTASLVTDGAGQPALSDPDRPDDGQALMGGDPVTLEQSVEQPAIETTRSTVIAILGHGMVA